MSPVRTTFRPGRRLAEHVGRRDGAAGLQRHVLPRLQPPARRAVGHAEPVGSGDVEPPGTLGLHERVAERVGAVLDREPLDRVLPALEGLPRLELDDGQRIRQPPDERPQPVEELAQAPRPVDRERRLVAAAQCERLQHPRQAEEVVGMEVREEDLLQVGQADRRPLQLPLRPLAAVEEEPLAAAPHEQRRGLRAVRSASTRRCRGRRRRDPRGDSRKGG